MRISFFNKGTERTLVLIKPDGVHRGLIGRVIQRFKDRQFKIITLRMMHASKSLLESHYAEHKDRPFFSGLIERMSSGPIVMMVLEGSNVVPIVRKMIGVTNPAEALPGTIRGDFCTETEGNLIHASDSVESAKREINLWNGCESF